MRFIAHVEEHGGISSELLNARLAVQLSIESSLDEAQRDGGEFHHFARPLDVFVLQLFKGDNFVDQSHVQCFLGVVLAAEEPDFARLLLTDAASHVGGAKAGIKTADAGPCLTKDGVLGGKGDVAHEVQHVPSTNGKAVDGGNHRLGHGADLLLHIQHAEAGYALVIHIATATLDIHVATRAEGGFAHACDDDDLHILLFAANPKGVAHLGRGQRGEGVAVAVAVDADAGNAAKLFKEDFLVFLDGGPFACGVHKIDGGFYFLAAQNRERILVRIFLYF